MPTESANTATVEVDAGTLRGRDGFDVAYTVTLPVHLHPSTVDRAAFAEAFGLGRTVAGSTSRIADHVRDRIVAAVKATPEQEASDLVRTARNLAPDIAKAVRTALFAVGLELAGEPMIAADSAALRAREAEHAAVEASKAAAKHAGDLLLRFEDIRRQNPDVSPGKLLMALPKEERYEALRLLFEGSARKDQSRLFLAAGTGLYELEGDVLREASDVGALGELGPARCLRSIGDSFYDLAIGARDGVLLFSTQHGRAGKPLRSRIAGDSPLGFNDISYHPSGGEWVWASHSTYGVEGWPLGEQGGWPSSKNATTGARCVAAISFGHISVDAEGVIRLVELDPVDYHDEVITLRDNPRPAVALLNRRNRREEDDYDDDPVAAVLVLASGLLVDLVRADAAEANLELHDGLSLERPLTAACAVPWLGDIRVAACVENGPILVAGPDDDVWIEYRSDHTDFAAVAASAGRLAAVTSDRQRLVIWNLSKPDAPEHDVHVLDTTRSRVADVAFL